MYMASTGLRRVALGRLARAWEGRKSFSDDALRDRWEQLGAAPHEWFPIARAIRRRVIYHSGPTNSGKTHSSLIAFRSAQSGVYSAPLRLLAMEVYEQANIDGTLCSLITGQEKKLVPGARHTACTVEMLDLQRRVDVGVIDEIQMIGDESRGWAWTRALLGLPASELHVAGDGSAVDLVRRLCEHTGEVFEVREYSRLSPPLEVEQCGILDSTHRSYTSIKPGDCVVAFSRNEIFAIKSMIERDTSHKAAVIYGNLPPEPRRQQAKLFNDPSSPYDVLVASDAVGMGLNLNIGRIVFSAMEKRHGGTDLTPISPSMTKQIAGRAGRLHSEFEIGRVATAERKDVGALQRGLRAPLRSLPRAGVYPEFEHFEVFASKPMNQGRTFVELLRRFSLEADVAGKTTGSYFLCRQESTMAIARLLDRVEGLSIKDMYSFCMAPASSNDLRIQAAMWQFASRYSRGEAVEMQIDPGTVPPRTHAEMRDFEAAHAVVTLWMWLSNRFSDEAYFPDPEGAAETAATICRLLSQGLERMSKSPATPDTTESDPDDGRDPAADATTRNDSVVGAKEPSRKARQTRQMGQTRQTEQRARTAKQLFHPYRNEFFALLKEKQAKGEGE